MQPYSILLPSAALFLPSTTSSHVNSGERFPLKGALLFLLVSALGFYAGRRWGLSADGWEEADKI